MHTHELLIEYIFPLPKDLLGLSTTRLFRLSLPPIILCHPNHGCDLSLLLKSNKLLRQIIHSLGNNVSLQPLDGAINDSILIALNKIPLLLIPTLLFPLFGGSKLSNQI